MARNLERFGPKGIPLVFVHGNAGNPGQARSIGSILQLKAEVSNMPDSPTYSVYTVDFDEVGGIAIFSDDLTDSSLTRISPSTGTLGTVRRVSASTSGVSAGVSEANRPTME